MPRMLESLSVLTGTRGQFISEATVRKIGQSAISEHLCIFNALSLNGQPTSFSCSPEYFNQKCAQFSSDLNGTIGRSL